jgi:hypothetical protein
MNNLNIAHAIGFCEAYLPSLHDTGEESCFTLIERYKESLSPQDAVSILKESVSNTDIPNRTLIIEEMNTREFKRYIAQRLRMS